MMKMGTLIQYLQEYGNDSFDSRQISDVDILLLTELAYLAFDDIVPYAFSNKKTLCDVAEAFLQVSEQQHHDNAFLVSKDRIELLKATGETQRFRPVLMSGFINEINLNKEKQFAAIAYEFPDGNHLVVYRGTDDTIIGWKEDFNLSYAKEVPAQQQAALHLTQFALKNTGNFYVSGHSKGGNLAIYASVMADYEHERLLGTYSFDGPGFQQEFLDTPQFQQVINMIHYYIPEEAIIGELLYRSVDAIILKSRQFNLLQHNSLNWEVQEGAFVTSERTTNLSVIIAETFKQWLSTRQEEDLKKFFDTLFSLFDVAGISSLNELASDFWGYFKKLRTASADLDTELHQFIDQNLNDMVQIGMAKAKEVNLAQWQNWQTSVGEWFTQLKEKAVTPFKSEDIK